MPYMRFALLASLVERELIVFSPNAPPATSATVVAPATTQRAVCDFCWAGGAPVKPVITTLGRKTAGTAVLVVGAFADATTVSGFAAGFSPGGVVVVAGGRAAGGGCATAVGCGGGVAVAEGLVGNDPSGGCFTPCGGPFFACRSFSCSSSISFSAFFTAALVFASGFSRRYAW